MSLLDMLGQAEVPETKCSRKGCREAASAELLWNNPKIHAPERRKVWLACSAHTEWLERYLQERGLWRETRALPTPAAGPPAGNGAAGNGAAGDV